jgi:hypothetical protein
VKRYLVQEFTLKFSLRHALPADIQTAWSIVMSDEFADASYAHSGTVRETLSSEEREDKTFSQLKITVQNKLPPIAAKVVGSTQLIWIQDQIINNQEFMMHWRIRIPNAEKISASGTFTLIPQGDHCLRIVEGDVQVKIPLIGNKVEQHVCRQLERSYLKTAIFTQEWLENKVSSPLK